MTTSLPPASSPPLVVIGFDAMDSVIARQMAEEGRLPTLAKFFREGASSTVTNAPGLVVGSTWPSFWTGLWPSQHGFYCFRQLEPRSYMVRRYTPRDITAPPFWSSMANAGRRVCIVDVPLVPLSQPPNGIHIIDWGTHDRMLEFAAWPPPLERELRESAAPYPLAGSCDEYSTDGKWDDLLSTLLLGIERKTELNIRLLQRDSWDTFVSVYCESHCAGHQFWWAHDREHPRYTPEAGDPLLKVYEALDAALARVLSHVRPESRVVVLLSHGIGSHHDGDHLLLDILTRLDESYAPTTRAMVFLEKVRRLLLRWGQRVRPRNGTSGTELDPRWVDASRHFIRLPNNELYGGVRINVAGREPRGRVKPGQDLEALIAWLERELLALTDPDTGRRIVHRVLRTSELYSGPLVDALPDLLIDWERSAPITAASSERIGVVRGEFTGPRSGDHRPAGLVLARGAGITSGRNPGVQMVDLAPTFAAMSGLVLDEVDGAPMPGLVPPAR